MCLSATKTATKSETSDVKRVKLCHTEMILIQIIGTCLKHRRLCSLLLLPDLKKINSVCLNWIETLLSTLQLFV